MNKVPQMQKDPHVDRNEGANRQVIETNREVDNFEVVFMPGRLKAI
jgi:hypothetical protein